MPKNKFQTTFGEMMAELGVKKLQPTPPTPARKPSPRGPAAGRPTSAPVTAVTNSPHLDAEHRRETRQLLDAINELQQQRSTLRAQLAERDAALDQANQQVGELRYKIRQLEQTRKSDMDRMAALRRELTSLRDKNQHLATARDALQRTLEAQPTTPTEAQDTEAQDTKAPFGGLTPDEDSDLRSAAFAFAQTSRGLGVERLVFVGGSPVYRQQLRDLLSDAFSLRLIGGRERRSLKQAKADVAWGDIVIIWGGSILEHRLSQLYRGESVITVSNRGLAGMLRQITAQLQ